MSWQVIEADCVEAMRGMDEASVDAIVTDPPYHLTFMGRTWDHAPSAAESQAMHLRWATEALRVLKPGGHLLAFGGTRTYHRLACAIEDAGFEIRDSLIWLYGSGFPKSLDVSKAIDRADDARRPEREAVGRWLREQREARGVKQKDVAQHWLSATGGLTGCVANWEGGLNCPTLDQWADLKRILDLPDDMDAEVWRLNGRKGKPGQNWEKREKIGERTTGIGTGRGTVAVIGDSENRDITAPASPEAQKWQGWGTALKPGHEPIVVARKPLVGTVAENVQQFGTGALNVDGCRVEHQTIGNGNLAQNTHLRDSIRGGEGFTPGLGTGEATRDEAPNPSGRWPANVTLSHLPECQPKGSNENATMADSASTDSPAPVELSVERLGAGHDSVARAKGCAPGCPVAELDRQSGERTSGKLEPHHADNGKEAGTFGAFMGASGRESYGDIGGASRFYYTAKSSRAERNAGLPPMLRLRADLDEPTRRRVIQRLQEVGVSLD
jgi:hypothetical protein